MFQALLSSVATGLGVTCITPPATNVVDVESVVLEVSTTGVIVAEALPAFSHSQYMITAVSVRNRGNSSTIVRSRKKIRLTTPAEPNTAVALKEDVPDVTEATELLHLSPEAVGALEA